jgi:crotonobetainyl-CoA:carnitine CoA-transferase CaiB-like acyl-CoA transferase
MGALNGLTVIDFSHYLAGPLATLWLAECGAEVIRIDPPGGPKYRHSANAILQRSKKSILLDLHDDAAKAIARRLIDRADVVVESFRPGVMERFGLGAEACLESNPRLVYCSIPGFAADDPRSQIPAWEGVVTAAGALYPRQDAERANPFGVPGTDPVFLATPVLSSFGGIVAAHSIIAALIARERSGRGQRVESPLFDAAFEIIGAETTKLLDRPLRPRPARNPVGGRRPPHHAHYRCADGRYINLCLIQDRHMPWFAKMFPPEWVADGMADPQRMRTDGPLQIRARARFRQLFSTKPAIYWERLINEELGVPTAICQTSEEWLREDEHASDAHAVIELDDPELGHVAMAGFPIHLSATPMEIRSPRHSLDADRADVLAGIGGGGKSGEPDTATPPLASALAGVRVVDVTQVLAGPTMSRVLAQYGAEVVKINSFEDAQLGAHFYTNNGKRSMLLDLKKPEGLEVLWRLVERADVFSQNFTKGVPERLGIAEPDVRKHQPEIIYSTISAFGRTGRRAPYRGREELGQAVTGMQIRWGGFGEEPATGHLAFTDYGTGHFAAFAVLVALYHRMRTGEGQAVHASLAQTSTFLQTPFMVAYEGRVWDEPNGRSLPKGSSPLDRFYQGGDMEWFYLAALGPDDAKRLGAIEGLADLEGLSDNEVELRLAADFVEAPAKHWVELLQASGIGAHLLVGPEELAESPEAAARRLTVFENFPVVGRVRTTSPARRLSMTPPRPGRLVGPPGHDTREILESIGFGGETARLFRDDVVGEALAEEIVAR